MPKFWQRAGGGITVDAQGRPIDCADCPCPTTGTGTGYVCGECTDVRATLYATFESSAPGCVCLNGLVIPLVNPSGSPGSWTGSDIACSLLGIVPTLSCNFGSLGCADMILGIACSNDSSPPPPSFGASPDPGCTCVPFYMKFSGLKFGGGGACNCRTPDEFSVTITE